MDLKLSNLKRDGSVTRLLLKYGRPDTGPVVLPEELEDAPPDAAATERGEALAADLESLGPTFIKLGQLLSSRGAFIPPEYSAALERLQDKVEPFSYAEVDAIVAEELGVRISKAFEIFEPEPIASASLGQVHRAILRDGREVVVKVQRPNIRQRILEDLEAFDEIAKVLEKHTSFGERMDLGAVLDEFRKTILEELDYRREADNLRRLAENLREYRQIVVPQPVMDYSSSRVLTMQYIAGRKVTNASPLTPLEVDGDLLLEELFQAYLQQILVDGFFHADPHPGNVFLTDDNRIALLDLGMVARLSPRMRDALLKMVLAIADGRGEDTADLALGTAEQRADVNAAEFRRRVMEMVSDYSGQGFAHRPIGQVFLDIVRAAVESGVRLPPETAMIGKTLYNLEATARVLSPEFSPSESIRKHSTKLMRQRMLKSLSPEHLFGGVLELREFVDRLPNRLNRILDAAADNQLGLKIDTGIDAPQMMRGFQKVANRIATGLVLAALIVGAAMLMQVETRFRIFGYPGLAIILFFLAVAGGVALVITIAAHDRRDQQPKQLSG